MPLFRIDGSFEIFTFHIKIFEKYQIILLKVVEDLSQVDHYPFDSILNLSEAGGMANRWFLSAGKVIQTLKAAPCPADAHSSTDGFRDFIAQRAALGISN